MLGGTRYDRRAGADEAASAAELVARQLVVVTGRLEIKSAHDGWLEAVILRKEAKERISVECPPELTRRLGENALFEVMACGCLRVVGGRKTLRLEWIRRRNAGIERGDR